LRGKGEEESKKKRGRGCFALALWLGEVWQNNLRACSLTPFVSFLVALAEMRRPSSAAGWFRAASVQPIDGYPCIMLLSLPRWRGSITRENGQFPFPSMRVYVL
jgi:hypothetical protein